MAYVQIKVNTTELEPQVATLATLRDDTTLSNALGSIDGAELSISQGESSVEVNKTNESLRTLMGHLDSLVSNSHAWMSAGMNNFVTADGVAAVPFNG
jgi:hypothetical protein